MSVLNKFDTKVVLWMLFCVQIFLIGLILGFGSILYTDGECSGDCSNSRDYGVQFIAKDSDSSRDTGSRSDKYRILDSSLGVRFRPIGNPFETFVSTTVPDLNETVWCFKEGTVLKGDSSLAVTEITEKGAVRCKCKSEWHGVDCGQPEVVWRSLFAAKAVVTTERRARNIFYIIRSTEHSLETLEIQLMELINVVDIFVLCFAHPQRDGAMRIRKFLDTIDKLKGHSERVFLKLEDSKCVPETLLTQLSRTLGRTFEDDDLILLSDQDEILNRKAINYLKWYTDGHELFRFRLKHIVYGYFWHHPRKTLLKSVIVKHKLLIQSKYALEELAKMENSSQMPSLLVIGDLNHYGGWYCQLCYQPLDIIAYLVNEINANESVRARHKSGVIDEEFVTKLIANGVNIYELLAREGNFEKTKILGGEPMDLVKLYPSSEKHYSPLYVQQSRGHFENIVRNQFAGWELDVVDDYNYYN